MRALLLPLLSLPLTVVACGGPAPSSPAAAPLAASEVATGAAKYQGKKVSVTGVYKQGFSNGGRPGDPWAVLLADAPASKDTVACLVPAKVEIPGRYPKVVATGTVDAPAGDRVYLKDCTYEVVK
ncbi:MAG: hypothetical protein IT374_05635 [Polyangiaceae bacterium]|nr:hypothetical protein [Polyangiaceae bacterium]